MSNETLPLSIRDVAPTADAVRLTGKTVTGLPSGCHTGGAWRVNDEVWKPLDGRPWVNCDCHVPTLEGEILNDLSAKGVPLFPKNWRIKMVNGREFVVRPNSLIFPDDISRDDLLAWSFDGDDADDALTYIENAIRTVNRLGWCIGDDVSLALDPSGDWFLYDLSNARRSSQADDQCAFNRFCEVVAPSRNRLRQNARDIQDRHILGDGTPRFFANYVYASFARPLGSWVRGLGECGTDYVFAHEACPSWSTLTPHSWLLRREPLDPKLVKNCELTVGYVVWPLPIC